LAIKNCPKYCYRARIINKVELNVSQGGADIDLIIHRGSKSSENKPLGHINTLRTIDLKADVINTLALQLI
jgi:hypothetical protein